MGSMGILTPAYFALCLAPGCGALTLILASALSTGRREIFAFGLFFTSLLLLVSSNFLLFSLSPDGEGGITGAMFTLMMVNKALSCLTFLSCVTAAQAVLDVPWKKSGAILSGILSLTSALLSMQSFVMRRENAAGTVIQPLPLDPIAPVGLLLILYSICLLLVFRRRIADPSVRKLTWLFMSLTAVFIPLIARDLFLQPDPLVIDRLPRAFVFFPLYLAVISVAVIVLSLYSFSRPRAASSVRVPDAGSLSLKYGLSERETEIAALITKGLGNKQIAFELGISNRTVGNHIYSLYRKLGINSRFELMGLLPPA